MSAVLFGNQAEVNVSLEIEFSSQRLIACDHRRLLDQHSSNSADENTAQFSGNRQLIDRDLHRRLVLETE